MNKKIIWIASYPKCGNTYLRAFLSHYLYNETNNFSFDNLKKIKKFETENVFKSVLNLENFDKNFLYYKHCIEVQKKLIKLLPQNKLIFKTHHFFGKYNGYNFTSENNTLFFIYLTRDPREVLVSYARHSGISIDEMLNILVDEQAINKKQWETKVNWKINYKSWKSFKSVPSYFIRYEDLVSDPKSIFSSIVFLLSRYTEIKYDEEKIDKIIEITKFNNLKKFEQKYGFDEAKSASFFNTGKTDSWKKILNAQQIIAVEKAFGQEMKELKYLR